MYIRPTLLLLTCLVLLTQSCVLSSPDSTLRKAIPDPKKIMEQAGSENVTTAESKVDNGESLQQSTQKPETINKQQSIKSASKQADSTTHQPNVTAQTPSISPGLESQQIDTQPSTIKDKSINQTREKDQPAATSDITEKADSKASPLIMYWPVVIAFIAGMALLWYLRPYLWQYLQQCIKQFSHAQNTKLQTQILHRLYRPLVNSLLLATLYGLTKLLDLPASYDKVLLSTLGTIAILYWMTALIRLYRLLVNELSENAKENSLLRPQTLPLFDNAGIVLIVFPGTYLIFLLWGIDIGIWLISAGIFSMAVSLAAKDTLANLFAGIQIMADRPYHEGDFIVLDNLIRGKVTGIGLRSTKLLTRDDVEVNIPNNEMNTRSITNESGGPHEHFRIPIRLGLPYTTDLDQLRQLLLDIAEAEKEVCDKPEPVVRFRSFGASNLDIELLCWIENPELQGRVTDLLYTTIYKRFLAEGHAFPYNKHDGFVKTG